MALSKERKSKLEKAGFKVGTVQEFLGLSDAEMMIIDMRIALGRESVGRRFKPRPGLQVR